MKKETSKKLSASLLASAIILNTVLSINADDGSNYHSAGESGVQGSFTSAPLISFNTLGTSGVDLKEGNFENWVDRVELPDYAVDMYNTISDETFWTNAENFSDSGSSPTYVTAEYGNGTSDKFNGLLVLESEPQNEDYSDDVKNGIRTALRAAFDAFDRDNPDVFWLTGETNFKSLVTYVKSGDTTTYTMKTYLVLKDYVTGWDMRREAYQDTAALGRAISDMDDAVDTILSGAGGTDYEKIKYFNKYLTESNEYNTVVSGNGETPEGTAEAYCAIFGGTGANGPVCEGYSRAFKVLCDEAGIPCVLTDGTADNGPHMWNYAKVGDVWYAVDVTWNDPVGGNSGAVSGYENEDYLLVGSETVVDSEAFGDTHIVSNTVSLSGISFTNGPELSDDAYVPTESEREYEAAIGGRKFATLEEAAAAASYDETVKLLDDISRDTNITIGASGTIDLDGKTISMNGKTITADKAFTLTDSAGTGSVDGNIVFSYGGTAESVALGDVFVSGGSLTMTDCSANSLSVVNGSASVSDSSFKGVSSPTDIEALLADGQMYFVDGTVITADKLDDASLSGDITVAAGKATGIIENKDYALSYIYGSDIPVPVKDNFTYYGEEPVFSWNTADNSIPEEAGTYTLTVTSGATDRVDAAVRNFTVEIEEYTSDAKATLSGEKGNNDWFVKNVAIVAPDGFTISTEYDGEYSDSIPVTEEGRKSVTYYLKESATGYIVPAQTIDVKADLNAPEFASSASILKLTASEASISVIATDGNGSGVSMYTAKFGSTELYSQNGLFNLIDLIPGTEYTLDVTVTDIAGNVATGTVKFTTESGTPSEIDPPSLTGTYGTAVKNMTISGGSVKFGTENVDGVWTITDANAYDVPEVGTKNTYKLTFTPSTSAYKPVEASVTPVVVPLGIENAVISGVQDSYDYTGDIIKPVVVVTLDGKTLADSDYVVEYGVNTNSGTDAGKVTVKGKGNYTGTAVTTFDILKIDTIITAVTRDIEKNFGDGSFNLGVITNNSETTLNYSVTNSDVVEVNEKGIAKIKGAGVTIVSVSQNETTNHKANISGVNIFITVNQGKAPVVDNVTVKFVHSMRNTGEVDMAEIMRAACSDCGPMTFSAYENSALLSGVYIYEDGTLTFEVDKGDVGNKGTVVVTVYSQNYEAATIRVIAELTDKFPTKAKGKVTAANNIT